MQPGGSGEGEAVEQSSDCVRQPWSVPDLARRCRSAAGTCVRGLQSPRAAPARRRGAARGRLPGGSPETADWALRLTPSVNSCPLGRKVDLPLGPGAPGSSLREVLGASQLKKEMGEWRDSCSNYLGGTASGHRRNPLDGEPLPPGREVRRPAPRPLRAERRGVLNATAS